MKQESHKFLFSVIIPVYNVEDYLDETIQSILNQTIGFRKNVELILVDDGSSDSSPQICQKYKDEYPDNVKFTQQKNGGPAVARDNGASIAEGKYLSLPDSDDKLSHNTLKSVYRFFEEHYSEIDVVTIPWEFFEARQGRDHPLNGKFYKDRVIDLSIDYSDIVTSVATSFFKADIFRQHKSHREVGRYAEDLRFIGEILLEKQKYGVVCDAFYHYRKRHSQTSSQDINKNDKFFYLNTPEVAIGSLLKYAKKRCDRVPRFIQFMTAYDLQWRIKSYGQTILSDEEVKTYQGILTELVKQIDDDVIAAVGSVHPEHKIFMLDLKYEGKKRKITESNGVLKYNETVLDDNYTGSSRVFVDFIEQADEDVQIEVNYLSLVDKVDVCARVGDKVYRPTVADRKPKQIKMFVNKTVNFPSRGYVFTIPIKDVLNKKVQFYANTSEDPLRVETRRYSRLSQKNKNSFMVKPSFMALKKKHAIGFTPRSAILHTILELRYLLTLLFRVNMRIIPHPIKLQWKMTHAGKKVGRPRRLAYQTVRLLMQPAMFIGHVVKADVKSALATYVTPTAHQLHANVYSVTMRLAYYITRLYYLRKSLWMFMDRRNEADDSAEILFEYTLAQNNPNITPYFTVEESSSDFSRLSKMGWTVPFLSHKQKLLFLHSKKVISSHADDVMVNPFLGLLPDVNDLYNFDFVFLQHGIIKDDLSDWLNRYNKNVNLFVTSVRSEYQSILDYQYFYDKNVVKITGLPRYDKLDDKPENKIALTPTWRNHLAAQTSDSNRAYSEEFKETYYFKYYQAFISDARLNKALKKYNYTMQMYIHPSFEKQHVDFKPGECVDIKKLPYDYKKVKSTSKLMVTDFSSVVFDFAYLRKPIIYGQFDEDAYWNGHTSNPGYFSYRKDGLGPVVTDLESTVDKVIDYLENDCKLENKYAKRIEKFFAFDDKNNAKRVYNEILKQDTERGV